MFVIIKILLVPFSAANRGQIIKAMRRVKEVLPTRTGRAYNFTGNGVCLSAGRENRLAFSADNSCQWTWISSYARVSMGGGRRRARQRGALLDQWPRHRQNQRDLSVGHARHQHHRLVRHRHHRRAGDTRRTDGHSITRIRDTVSHDRHLRRLHDVFLVQPANLEPVARPRMALCRRQYDFVRRAVHDCRVAGLAARRDPSIR